MPQVEFRRARPQDFSAILKLQSDNYIGNLPVEERKQGFLSAEFAPEQVAEMAGDIGIIVASKSESILGYLCGFRCDFNRRSPVIAKMLKTFARVYFQGKPPLPMKLSSRFGVRPFTLYNLPVGMWDLLSATFVSLNVRIRLISPSNKS